MQSAEPHPACVHPTKPHSSAADVNASKMTAAEVHPTATEVATSAAEVHPTATEVATSAAEVHPTAAEMATSAAEVATATTTTTEAMRGLCGQRHRKGHHRC
jgi:methyl-accepting chemotaxis protein